MTSDLRQPEWKLLEEIEEYLFQTKSGHLRSRIKGRVTTEKVVTLLKELTRFEHILPVYHENKDTEIAGQEDVGEGIRNCATDFLKKWEALEQ